MMLRKLSLLGAVALPFFFVTAAQAPLRAHRESSPAPSSGSFATRAPAAWAEADPADSLYRAAREALNDEDYRQAARLFSQITTKYPKSVYSAEALYFRAFALYRMGGESNLRDALSVLETHKNKFPKARTSGDADQLAIRIQGQLAQRGDADAFGKVQTEAMKSAPCTSGDRDDIKSAAMDALLQMRAENAVPIIRQVLSRKDDCNAAMRKKAMFLLSQTQSSEAESLIIDAINNDPSMTVREDAVFWLGQMQSDRAGSTLENLAMSPTTETRLRDKAIFSLSQQNSGRALSVMRRFAESTDTPRKLRESAIFQIGQHQSSQNADYLKSLFTKLPRGEEELKKSTLFSLSQMQGYGNAKWLVDIALDESQSIEVRKHALFCAGQNGVSGRELTALYDRVGTREVKEQLIWVMSEARDPAAADRLVEIAKKDKDPEMRKKALFWLGQRNDPRIRQLLLDILKEP